jgi:hypothetical protein
MIRTDPNDRPDLKTTCEVAATMKARTMNNRPQNVPRPVPPAVKKANEQEEAKGGEEGPALEKEGEEAKGGEAKDQDEGRTPMKAAADPQATPPMSNHKEPTPSERHSTPKLRWVPDASASDLCGSCSVFSPPAPPL